MAKYIPDMMYGMPKAMKPFVNDFLSVSRTLSSVLIISMVIQV